MDGTDSKEAPSILKTIASPEKIWETPEAYSGNHTFSENVQMKDGSMGVIGIPVINLSVNVYESKTTDTVDAMSKGVAHFPNTSAWDGNVGLSAHNVNFSGSDGYFKNLYTLKQGDSITYKTAIGERKYVVTAVKTISQDDWSALGYTEVNQITLITCITGQPNSRLCVTAEEVKQ